MQGDTILPPTGIHPLGMQVRDIREVGAHSEAIFGIGLSSAVFRIHQYRRKAERLDVIPAKFRVIISRRPKYAFKGWDGVIQALAPPHTIENGLPTEALLAQIAVSKYADGLPLYRQKGIYARDGVDCDRLRNSAIRIC